MSPKTRHCPHCGAPLDADTFDLDPTQELNFYDSIQELPRFEEDEEDDTCKVRNWNEEEEEESWEVDLLDEWEE